MGYVDVTASLVPTLCVAVLRSSFAEPSEQVRGTMWRSLLKFLKGMPWPGFCRCCRSFDALQLSPERGRLMFRLNSTKQTKVSLRKTIIPARKKNQKYNLLLCPFPKTDNHQVSRTFCSSWSLVVVVRLCRVTLLSSSSLPQSRLLFVLIILL